MPITYRCDRCGKAIEADSGDHFVVRIEAFAAEGPLEISQEDLEKDLGGEIRKTIEQLEQMPLDAVEDQIYRAFRFDLCRACHAVYLRDPLGPMNDTEGDTADDDR